MTETRFTPGPWVVLAGFGCTVVPKCDEHKQKGGASDPDAEAARFAKVIADERGTNYPDFHRSRVVHGEAEANARLIAAGPDMYEALKAVEDANQIGSWEHAMNKVRAALAKAVPHV